MTLTQIQHLAELLHQLQEADNTLRVFGADEHEYKLGPTLTESELQEFEQRHQITLPVDYRLFLIHVGNGGAGPSYGLYNLDKDRTERAAISKPFNWTSESIIESEEDWQYWSQGRGIIGLCHHGCSNFSYLVVNGPTFGKVWDEYETTKLHLSPTGLTFYEWYRNWIEDSLSMLKTA